tara:strand:- start:848 stop:1321 length:474 start_codon:yes stop_codon:yes gene_type:complete
MNHFIQCFVGKFDNKDQAYSRPAEFAHIIIEHKNLGMGFFSCVQSYVHDIDNPYKKYKIQIEQKDNYIIAKSFTWDLEYKHNCDIQFYQDEIDRWYGKSTGQGCIVNVNGTNAYQLCDIRMTKDTYWIIDLGLNVNDKTDIVWGSRFGHMKFDRVTE